MGGSEVTVFIPCWIQPRLIVPYVYSCCHDNPWFALVVMVIHPPGWNYFHSWVHSSPPLKGCSLVPHLWIIEIDRVGKNVTLCYVCSSHPGVPFSLATGYWVNCCTFHCTVEQLTLNHTHTHTTHHTHNSVSTC